MIRYPLAQDDRSIPPLAILAVGLTLGVAVLLLPARWTAPIKQAALTLLEPGQRAAASLRYRTAQWIEDVRSHLDTAAKLREARGELERLQCENRRLAAQLVQAQQDSRATSEHAEPLLRARAIPANVLGRQARAFLVRHELLDVGTSAGAELDALVLDASAALVDRGQDAGVKGGRLVLGAGHIWGRVIEVGSHVSVVRTITAAGYRDLVRLAAEGDRPSSGPQGILEGTGEPLARIRAIEVTEPVAVGDAVWAATGQGVLPKPLLYGRVVRAERPAGSAHWEIWMKPAVDTHRVEEVLILQPELNPSRMQQQ